MRSAGIVLILCGAFVLYQVLHGRLASAQASQSPSSGGGGGGGGGGGSRSSDNPDSGSHSALGSDGSVYTIDKSYGDMSDSEKDDANRYAHSVGNVSG